MVTSLNSWLSQELTLDDEVIRDRMKELGSSLVVHLDPAIRDIAVSRVFMSAEYGGGSQETCPNIGQEKLKAHGLNDFMVTLFTGLICTTSYNSLYST